MSIMSDKWIKEKSLNQEMIAPFVEKQVRQSDSEKIISYGVSSYGYDARVSNEFKIFTNINTTIVDPKNFWTAKNVTPTILSLEKMLTSKNVDP